MLPPFFCPPGEHQPPVAVDFSALKGGGAETVLPINA